VETDPRFSPGPSADRLRTIPHPQRRHPGQPVRQDHRKRGPRGYDAGKKINGRKRHLVVDTLGLILALVVHEASLQDRVGAKRVLLRLRQGFHCIQRIWGDGAYTGPLAQWIRQHLRGTLEIIKRNDTAPGFHPLPRRWIVERTFAWLGRYRRLAKDYEQHPDNSEAIIYIAMINLMSRRLDPSA
jgi:putative transposase